MLYVIAVSHTSQNSTGNHFVIQAILHTNFQPVQLLNSSPRHFLKKDTWHHRYQNKLGVSVLSISHLVYLNIKQSQQRNHNQCKLVQWTWELPSLLFSTKLWHFMECSVASTGYRIKFLMMKNKQTLRTVFTKRYVGISVLWNVNVWCGIPSCFLNKKCWAWKMYIFTTKHKSNDLLRYVVSATAYNWKLR